jgi:hypothetical protein
MDADARQVISLLKVILPKLDVVVAVSARRSLLRGLRPSLPATS